jgi:prephenate dehydrogenase
MKKFTIGIVGGKGKMGEWFSGFFSERSFAVLISDIGTRLTNEELVKKSDAVIFTVPISKTVAVIESVLPFTRKEQILMDLTSIKVPAVGAMMGSDCEVLGMHPMFGPFVKTMENQTIVLCNAREREKTKVFSDLFRKAGARLKISTADEHDRMMSVIQGMTHFSSIAMAHNMLEMGIDVDESISYTSPVYKINMEMTGRIMAQDPNLYAEIELYNPYTKECIERLVESSNTLLGIIEKKDKAAFIKYFEDSSRHMQKFREKALAESNKLIGDKHG